MDKILFKGIKQVTMETYQSETDKKQLEINLFTPLYYLYIV